MITVLSWLGVVAGVLVLIVVQCVMRGFEQELTRKVIGFQSHLAVAGTGPLPEPARLMQVIRQEPGVSGASPAVLGPVLADLDRDGPHLYVDLGPSGSMATAVKYNLPPESRSESLPLVTPFGQERRNIGKYLERIRS